MQFGERMECIKFLLEGLNWLVLVIFLNSFKLEVISWHVVKSAANFGFLF